MTRRKNPTVVLAAWRHLRVIRLGSVLLLLSALPTFADDIVPAPEADPHYTEVGFFDIHVCNWPDQPLFFLALFSTTQFQEVESIAVFTPGDTLVGTLDLTRFRLIKQEGKPEKRAFLKHLAIPEGAGDGWYHARITMRSGRVYAAQDYVVIRRLDRAAGLNPPPDAENIALPNELSWNPIPGAKHYQVFVRDEWDGSRLIFESKLLNEPRVALPPGLLQPGGYYSWRIHARDVNENVLLGDFNHGSMNREATFSVASE